MATSIAVVADRAWLESIAGARRNDASRNVDDVERTNRWANAIATSAARSVADVLPAAVVSAFTAQLSDLLVGFPDVRTAIASAAAGLQCPVSPARDAAADDELERHLHLLVAVVSGTTAVNDFLLTLLRVLRERSPGLVALSFGAAAAFLTAAATSSARLAGVDHERSLDAFDDAVALVDEHVGELLGDERAMLERSSMRLHVHPRDPRMNALPREIAGEHVTAMLAMGEMLARRVLRRGGSGRG